MLGGESNTGSAGTSIGRVGACALGALPQAVGICPARLRNRRRLSHCARLAAGRPISCPLTARGGRRSSPLAQEPLAQGVATASRRRPRGDSTAAASAGRVLRRAGWVWIWWHVNCDNNVVLCPLWGGCARGPLKLDRLAGPCGGDGCRHEGIYPRSENPLQKP